MSPLRSALDQRSIEVLDEVRKASGSVSGGLDAVLYRAQHEGLLNVLDKLEAERYLVKDNERYRLTLCGLAVLDDSNSKEIFGCCEKLFAILRERYKLKPRESISITELASAVGFNPQKASECLAYMLEGSWWQSHNNDPSKPEKGSVQPSERILRYKTFREVIDDRIESHQKQAEYHRGRTKAYPVDAVASPTLVRVDAWYIKEAWEKALERRSTDPDGAITSARSLLETVCKYILDEGEVSYGDNPDLAKLYRLTAQRLNLAPDSQSQDVLRRILGSCQTVVAGLGSMRNQLSDAHGKGKATLKPAPRHAELAVNLAGTIASFLIQTWEARKIP